MSLFSECKAFVLAHELCSGDAIPDEGVSIGSQFQH
jgi:hypothetical protein